MAIVGQTAMPAERLARAPKLRAIVNVEGNFLPNVDYAAASTAACTCSTPARRSRCRWPRWRSGWRSTSRAGSARADRAMRAGTEVYGLDGNADAFLLSGSPVGIVGFGDLGRELHRLLAPFRCPVKVYDPWLPDLLIARAGARAGAARRRARDSTRDLRVRVGRPPTTRASSAARSSSASARVACCC